MLCEDLNGKEIQKRGSAMCTCIAGSLCCTAETNTTLHINYTPVKFFFNFKIFNSYMCSQAYSINDLEF